MSDWICKTCGKIVRGRIQRPAYCSRCGLNKFEQTSENPTPFAQVSPELYQDSYGLGLSVNSQFRRLTAGRTTPGPHRERRLAKRIQPKDLLEVRLFLQPPLKALNISAIGVLVEHSAPFPPGAVCDVRLCRSGRMIRLRGLVVRSSVIRGGPGPAAIRYRTGVQFLETPETIFAVLPELAGARLASRS